MGETKRRLWELVREVTSATVTPIIKYTALNVSRQYPLVLLVEVFLGGQSIKFCEVKITCKAWT